MKINLRVTVDGMFGRYTACCEVPETLCECFEPVKVADDNIMSYVNGEMLMDSIEVRKVLKLREDAAKILSKTLAEMVVNAMGNNDTYNGY